MLLLFYWLLPLSHCRYEPKYFPWFFYLSLSRSICACTLIYIGPFKTKPLQHTGRYVEFHIGLTLKSQLWNMIILLFENMCESMEQTSRVRSGFPPDACVFWKPEHLRVLCVRSGNGCTCLTIPNLQYRNICAGILYLIQSTQPFHTKIRQCE